MTRMIIRAVANAGRNDFIRYLKDKLPDAEWCFDKNRSATDTFILACQMAGPDAVIHMEEDIILTKTFREKIEAVITQKPGHVIQFFSMRKADLTQGSRWDTSFMMAQCFYMPSGLSMIAAKYIRKWLEKTNDHGAPDLAFEHMRREMGFKVWIHVPSLVEHRKAKSLLGPRSSKRQSFTFQDPDE